MNLDPNCEKVVNQAKLAVRKGDVLTVETLMTALYHASSDLQSKIPKAATALPRIEPKRKRVDDVSVAQPVAVVFRELEAPDTPVTTGALFVKLAQTEEGRSFWRRISGMTDSEIQVLFRSLASDGLEKLNLDPGPAPDQELQSALQGIWGRLTTERTAIGDKCVDVLRWQVRRMARRLNLSLVDPDPLRSPGALYRWFGSTVTSDLHTLGNDLYKQGAFDEAIQCFSLVLQLDPELLETYFNRGLAYTRKSWHDPALEDLSEVIALNPNLAEAFYTRGLVLEYKSEFTQAIEQYRKALEIDPDYEKAAQQIEVARKKEKNRSTSSSESKAENKVSEELTSFEPYIEKADVTLEDFAGTEETKQMIRHLCKTLAHGELVKKRGGKVPKGVLLHGLPGVGKTHLARILAHTLDATFYNVKSSDILNMWFGNSEKNLDKLFADAAARKQAVIFFDEVDEIAVQRRDDPGDCRGERRLVSGLLRNMDGLSTQNERVLVLAATNDLEVIDKALLRPGRFTYCLKIDKPDVPVLRQLYEIHLRQARKAEEPLPMAEMDCQRLAEASLGLVGDDVREIVARALDAQILWEIDHGSVYPLTTEHLLAELGAYRRQRKVEERVFAGFAAAC